LGERSQVTVYHPRSGKPAVTLKVPAEVTDLAFDRTGNLLASLSSVEGAVRLWDPATGELLATFPTGQRTPTRVALGPGGRWLATGDAEGQVRVWDVAEARRRLRDAGLDWSPAAPEPQRGSGREQ
jgi:WD40 repeat protein